MLSLLYFIINKYHVTWPLIFFLKNLLMFWNKWIQMNETNQYQNYNYSQSVNKVLWSKFRHFRDQNLIYWNNRINYIIELKIELIARNYLVNKTKIWISYKIWCNYFKKISKPSIWLQSHIILMSQLEATLIWIFVIFTFDALPSSIYGISDQTKIHLSNYF